MSRTHHVLRLGVGTLHRLSYLIFTTVQELGLSLMQFTEEGTEIQKVKDLPMFTLKLKPRLLTITLDKSSKSIKLHFHGDQNQFTEGWRDFR